ncbi:AbiV family abortive infection protein [candidate division WS5 bacterium]|uniref:AbiV family abortive infection protein n=1 Tax=candidate division WS5 bacterium TaxID=2093353 RepID=A0A419DB17_9BACT|nr:MAG: AbiV family abortive infection protein [candidate division WS5 bacterium]
MKKNLQELIKKTSNAKELTSEQLIDCLKKCMENAEALVKTADLLFNNKLYGPSITISVLSLEEIGKAGHATYMLLEDKPNELLWYLFWEKFKDHQFKIRSVIASSHATARDLLGKPLTWQEMIDVSPGFDKLAKKYHNNKLKGMYVDYDKNKGKFVIPKSTRQEARDYLEFAKKNLNLIAPIGKMKEEEIFKALMLSKEVFKEENKRFEIFLPEYRKNQNQIQKDNV